MEEWEKVNSIINDQPKRWDQDLYIVFEFYYSGPKQPPKNASTKRPRDALSSDPVEVDLSDTPHQNKKIRTEGFIARKPKSRDYTVEAQGEYLQLLRRWECFNDYNINYNSLCFVIFAGKHYLSDEDDQRR